MNAYSFTVESSGGGARCRFHGRRDAIPVERARIRIPDRSTP